MRPCHPTNQLPIKSIHSRRAMLTSTSTTTRPKQTRTRTRRRRKPTLLLTFDAFGTLFHPRQPVPEQYATTAHSFGLSRTLITPERLKRAFKEAFKTQLAKRPNYGREDVLRGRYGGPRQWWGEVIRESFWGVMKSGGYNIDNHNKNNDNKVGRGDDNTTNTNNNNVEKGLILPEGLIDTLINRFASSEGYMLYDDVLPFFRQLRSISRSRSRPSLSKSIVNDNDNNGTGLGTIFDRVILGVISNTDDRVPAVLKSLGLSVGDTRADQGRESMELPGFEERRTSNNVDKEGKGKQTETATETETETENGNDIDLIITSYEAGAEKPSRLIFDVAKRQAHRLTKKTTDDTDEKWVYVHVGDDYEKDYKAAINAGWDSYLLPRGNSIDGFRDVKVVYSLVDLVGELERRYS